MTKETKAPKGITTKAMPALLAGPALLKAIEGVHGAMQKVQESVQITGTQCLMHLAKCNDIGPANRLVMGMPVGARKNAIVGWLLSHGALVLNPEPLDRKERLFLYDKSKKTDADAAWAEPWTDHQPERAAIDVFDLSKALGAILRRIGDHPIKINGKELDADARSHHLAMLKALYEPTASEKATQAEQAAAQT